MLQAIGFSSIQLVSAILIQFEYSAACMRDLLEICRCSAQLLIMMELLTWPGYLELTIAILIFVA